MSGFIIIYSTSSTFDSLSKLRGHALLSSEYSLLFQHAQLLLYEKKDDKISSMFITENKERMFAVQGEDLPRSKILDLQEYSLADISRNRHDYRGVVALVDKLSGKLTIANDILGSIPFYYWISPDKKSVIAGTRFRDIFRMVHPAVDELGVYQFLCAGYTIGSRTLAKDVKQLLPAESIMLSSNGLQVIIESERSVELWVDHRRRRLTTACLDELESLWREETGRLANTQLMFSAGWDSRTLLAGMAANRIEKSAVAYSHGDGESRELMIASAIASEFALRRQVQPLEAGFFSMSLMNDMLESAESSLFPYWAHAASWGRSEGYESLTGGIFGGILGGHYSTPSVMHGVDGAAALLKYIVGFNDVGCKAGDSAVDTAAKLLCPARFVSFWCVRDDVNARWERSFREEFSEDIRGRLEAYPGFGRASLDNIVEAFQVENRGRQYMNGQINIARNYTSVINPFTNPDLLRIATNIPLSYKVHNKVNRLLIGRLEPRLLNYPMGATLVKAKHGVFTQEGSRLLRKSIEGVRWKLYKKRQQSIRPNMGWVNFEFLRTDDFVPEIIDSLQLSIWSKEKMTGFFESYPLTSMHPLFDMLMKIKTIDYRLGCQAPIA